ncbi:MAG: hypothetical protein QF473_35225, partial [Planctomycetota bacterium]|nr:hypothetical protein [Planctomycetota bacterium]
MNRYSILLVCLFSLRPGPAEESVKADLFKAYTKSRPRFEVSVPPLASPDEKHVTIIVSIEHSDSLPAALHGKEAIVRFGETQPVEKKAHETAVRMEPGKLQDIEFQVPVRESAWEATLVFEDKKVLAQGIRFLNYFQAHRGLAVEPHSRWIRDAGGKLVCLYQGQAPEPGLRQERRKQPVILNLTSAMLWDDYYLP